MTTGVTTPPSYKCARSLLLMLGSERFILPTHPMLYKSDNLEVQSFCNRPCCDLLWSGILCSGWLI